MRHGTITAYRYHGCRCQLCTEANRRARAVYVAAHPDEIRAIDAAGRAAHPEIKRARDTGYRAAHRAQIRVRDAAHSAARRAAHPERLRAYFAAWRAAHPELVRAHDAAYHSAHLEQDRAKKYRRRARLAGVASESFTLADVVQRDGWRCQLCGQPVDPERRWPDPKLKSLDHVIPLSRGGPHTLANAQLAHHGCNSRKRDRDSIHAPLESAL
jgi:5-methylcytosine-specific restriction endonuclease McrA